MNRWSAAVYGALAGAMIAYPRQAAEAALEAMRLWARAAACRAAFLCRRRAGADRPALALDAAAGLRCLFPGRRVPAMQNAAFWQESGVTARSLLLLRLAHAAVSFFLCFALTRLLTAVIY